MSDAGGLSLGVELGIVLGCLLIVTFIAGGIKLYISNRRTERKRIEEAAKANDEEKLVQTEFNEGNLFGVRAIEHGFYGGVAQRPASPSPSNLPTPESTEPDWSKKSKPSSSSPSSVSSYPQSLNPAGMKPSPLRLEATSPSTVGGIGGSYMPPMPSPRSNRTESPVFGEPKPAGWISPLDVHFSKPSNPQPYRPTSYLPRLNLDFGKGDLMPTSNDTKSKTAPAVSSEFVAPTPSGSKSPIHSVFTNQLSTVRAAQQSLRAMYPLEDELISKSGSNDGFSSQPVPLKDLSPKATSASPDTFPQHDKLWASAPSTMPRNSLKDNQWGKLSPSGVEPVSDDHWEMQSPTLGRSVLDTSWSPGSPTIPDSTLDAEWDRSKPIIRNSMVSKQRVSVIRPTRASQISPFALPEPMPNRFENRQSVAASSMYSIESSIPGTENHGSHERVQSHAAHFDFSRDTFPSGAAKRSSRARSITRARDSLDNLSFSVSGETLHGVSERSRSQSTTRQSGQQTRESPFSNSHAASEYSQSIRSSFSSYAELPDIPPVPTKPSLTLPDLENFPFPASARPPPPRAFDISAPPTLTDYLTVNHNRVRTASEVSQASIGEFYDSYYRQSTMQHPGGQYLMDPPPVPISVIKGERTLVGPIRHPPRRPAPLNLSKMGEQYAGHETIVEIVTPKSGAFGPATFERFPSRI